MIGELGEVGRGVYWVGLVGMVEGQGLVSGGEGKWVVVRLVVGDGRGEGVGDDLFRLFN